MRQRPIIGVLIPWQIVTNDLGRSGSGGAQSDTDTVKLYVGAVVVTNTDGGAANGNTTSISALAASDGGDGLSLREAIIATNNTAGTDYIYFGISGTGVHTIAPTSALPAITGQVIIDATTDDSFAANGNRPAIVLDGNDLAHHGVVLSAGSGGSTVRGLVIRNFGLDGLNIETGSDNNVIQGNYLGAFTTDGTSAGAAFQNAQRGISVSGANNLIGGTAPGEGNLVGGNLQSGIRLDGASATGNVVSGNLIGVAIDGTTPVSNEAAGVVIDNGASGNLIGGTSTAANNVIAYSGRDGIRVINASSWNAFCTTSSPTTMTASTWGTTVSPPTTQATPMRQQPAELPGADQRHDHRQPDHHRRLAEQHGQQLFPYRVLRQYRPGRHGLR